MRLQLLLAAVGLLLGRSCVAQPPTVPAATCEAVPPQLVVISGLVRAVQRVLPSGALCSIINSPALNTSLVNSCDAVNLFLGSSVEVQAATVTCNASIARDQRLPVATTPGGVALPLPLSDARPLPVKGFPAEQRSALWGAEGATYYWLFRIMLNIGSWYRCHMKDSIPLLVPEGWTVTRVLYALSGPPGGIIMTKDDTMVVALRGVEGKAEWLLNSAYSQTASQPDSVLQLPGATHAGFTAMASHIWPAILEELEAHFTAAQGGTPLSQLYIGGFSGGAAQAQLIGYAAQTWLNAQATGLLANVVLIAPPNVGDSVFATAYNKLVNARHVSFEYDIVPQLPCTANTGGMAACGTESGEVSKLSQWLPGPVVDTSRAGLSRWLYQATGGQLTIRASSMPAQSRLWSLLSGFSLCAPEAFNMATHVCSYECALSRHVGDTQNSCLLLDPARLLVRAGQTLASLINGQGINIESHSVCTGATQGSLFAFMAPIIKTAAQVTQTVAQVGITVLNGSRAGARESAFVASPSAPQVQVVLNDWNLTSASAPHY